MTRRQYAGGAARTTTSGSIASSGGGTVVIASVTGWPDGSVGKFHVVIDPGLSSEEKILVDSRTGTTLTFSVSGRGADGSVATSHASGATIWHCFTAQDADEANAHINQATASHTAAQISFAPTAGIAATTVQAAIAELEGEAADARLDLVEANGWVTPARIAADAVTTAKILDANVTPAKYAPTTLLLISRAATQTIANGATAFVTFDTETTDPTGMFTAPSFTITVQAAGAGLVVIEFQASPSAAGGAHTVEIQLNGTPQRIYSAGPTVNISPACITATTRVAASDTINGFIKNGSGVSQNYTASLRITRLAA